jgi:hypothetical protein
MPKFLPWADPPAGTGDRRHVKKHVDSQFLRPSDYNRAMKEHRKLFCIHPKSRRHPENVQSAVTS